MDVFNKILMNYVQPSPGCANPINHHTLLDIRASEPLLKLKGLGLEIHSLHSASVTIIQPGGNWMHTTSTSLAGAGPLVPVRLPSSIVACSFPIRPPDGPQLPLQSFLPSHQL
jgi:hypothetical protein